MPGFMINGDQRDQPNSVAEVRRTHRWVFKTIGTLKNRDVCLVLKSASRPSITFEEPPMHHNQEQIYFAGKHTWEPLAMAWYDVEQEPDVSKAMWDWMEVCMPLTEGKAANVNTPRAYKSSQADLEMIKGNGDRSEAWEIYNGWPQAINWNALDYSASDLQLIEVKYRYDRAVRAFGPAG